MNPFEMPFPNPFGKTWLTSSFEAPVQIITTLVAIAWIEQVLTVLLW